MTGAGSARHPAGGLLGVVPQPSEWRPWRSLALLLLALLVLVATATKLLPVRYVRVEGALRRVEPRSMQAVLEPLLEGGYLLVDLNAMDAAARSLPWVGDVSVKRYWPDTLVVKVTEQTPYARCSDGSLVSGKGVRFHAAMTPEMMKLPLLQGPDGNEKSMLAMLMTMNAKLAPLGRRIAILHLSNRHAWTLKLEDGLVVAMGKQEALAAFERFLMLATLLGTERLQAVQRVDLRYPNGYAVSVRPKAEKSPSPLS